MAAAQPAADVSADFPIAGVTRVIFRAANTKDAKVTKGAAGHVSLKGRAQGGAAGYHSSDPNWKETKAKDWGLGFVSKQYGDTLVVSTLGEILYIHHSYYIDGISITVPQNVNVVLVTRRLNGEGAADLTPPVVHADANGDLTAWATGPYQEVHHLWELTSEVNNAVQEVIGQPIADADADWQSSDVIRPGAQLPARRLVIAGKSKNRAIVVYEHGGYALHSHLLAFELSDGAPRLVASTDINPRAHTLDEVTAAMKKPLSRAGHV